MNIEPNQDLCGLIKALDLDQFKRYMDDNCFADQVLDHVARCSNHDDLEAKEKFNILLENLIAREGVKFPEGSQWKHEILAAQTLHVLWASGIPAP